MRAGLLWLMALLVCLAAGCTVSRHIRDVRPPAQSPLQQLEQHLDYVDPDAGKPDYVIQG